MGKNMVKAANNPKTSFHNLRYERKFIFQNIHIDDLIDTQVFTNSFCFQEIFKKRTINNIYFDDYNYSFYKQNVSGDGLRKKYRLRWYNDLFSEIKKPTIEIKKKFGNVGDKISHKIIDFSVDLESIPVDKINPYLIKHLEKTKQHGLISKLESLHPTLYNSYERRYFLSNCEKFRITLDFNMNFYNPNTFRKNNVIKNQIDEIILELKYNTEHDSESRVLTQEIDSRLSKNSKYVRGLDFINYQVT